MASSVRRAARAVGRGSRCAIFAACWLALPLPSPARDVPAERVSRTEVTPEVARAINRGLEYLKRNQNQDGSWGEQYLVAETAFSLLAFLVSGNEPEEEPYGDTMDAAISFLLDSAAEHGGYFADPTSQVLYQHSYATLALAEVWGQSKREDVGDALKAAVDILMRAQGTEGGWRYSAHPSGHDISCTGTAIQALASAKEAGILVPEHVLQRARNCMRQYQDERTGFFNYTHGGGGDPALFRSAIGPLALYLLGDRDSIVQQRGVSILRKYTESPFGGGGHYYLSHYYGVQSAYQAGDSLFQRWYPMIRRELLAKQQGDGSWEGGHGPFYYTACAVLILGVPYRYLPIYQR